MGWEDFTKKYAWDESKTPYLVRVKKLTQNQARKEIFAYVFFLAVIFAVITLISLADPRMREDYAAVTATFHAFSLFGTAIYFGVTKHPYAAIYCVTAPVAAFLIVINKETHPDMETLEKVVAFGFMLLWLRYSLRVVSIARAYPSMPQAEEG